MKKVLKACHMQKLENKVKEKTRRSAKNVLTNLIATSRTKQFVNV